MRIIILEENVLSFAAAEKSIGWRVFLMLCKCDKSISFAQLKYGFVQDKKLKPVGVLEASTEYTHEKKDGKKEK